MDVVKRPSRAQAGDTKATRGLWYAPFSRRLFVLCGIAASGFIGAPNTASCQTQHKFALSAESKSACDFTEDLFAQEHCLTDALLLRPAEIGIWIALGQVQEKLKQIEQAEVTYRSGLALNPKSPELLDCLASLLAAQKRYKAAIFYWHQAVDQQPRAKSYRLSLGVAYSNDSQYTLAITTLENLTRDYPAFEEAVFSLGSVYARQENFSKAVDAYNMALKIDPADQMASLSLAKVLITTLRYEEARPILERYVARQPNEAEALSLLGRSNRYLGNLVDSQKELQRAVELSPDLYDAEYDLGLIQLETGDPEAALIALQHAATLKPDSVGPHFQLSKTYRALHEPELASKELALSEDKRREQADERRAVVLANQASVELGAKNAKEAAADYQEALTLDPGNARLYYDLSLAYEQQGDVAGEQRTLIQAEKLDPTMATVHNQLGNVYLQAHDLKKAKEEFGKAIAADPDCADALSNLGVLSGTAADISAAEALFRRALESEPGLIQAHINLGLIFAAEGNFPAALRAEDEALVLSPHDRAAQLARTRIEYESRKSIVGADSR